MNTNKTEVDDAEMREIQFGGGLDKVLQPGRFYATRDGKIFSRLMGRQRQLSPYTDRKTGYVRIGIGDHKCYLHRVIAMAFIPNPLGLDEVNHKDHDKANSHADNLEWVTHKENLAKARVFHGNWTTGEWLRKPIEMRKVGTDEWVKWESARAWAISTGNFNRAANVCTAIKKGRVAYGAEWRYVDGGGARGRMGVNGKHSADQGDAGATGAV